MTATAAGGLAEIAVLAVIIAHFTPYVVHGLFGQLRAEFPPADRGQGINASSANTIRPNPW
jgi:hypothetical protein